MSGDADDVRRALRNIFAACELHALRSVALPALGCGTGGLALATFARIAREELEAHAPRAEHLERVKIVLHDAEAYAEVAPAFR